MKLKIVVDEYNYFQKLLAIFSHIPPFSKLRPKELQLYALLMFYNHKYRQLPPKDRNINIFHYSTKEEMAEELNIKVSGIYNLIQGLRKMGLVKQNSLVAKYILPKTNVLTFLFVSEDELNTV